MFKRLFACILLTISVLTISTVSTSSVNAAACSGYSNNGYFGGAWFNFSSNSVVSAMISRGELSEIFTTDSNGNSLAIPDNRFSLSCVAPTFSVQSAGSRGLYLVGSGWANAGFGYNEIVDITNGYLASRFIFPTTTVAATPTTAATTTSSTTTTTLPLSFCVQSVVTSYVGSSLRFFSSVGIPNNPVFSAYSPTTWFSMSHALRIGAGAVYIPVSRGTSCSQFDSLPEEVTTTSAPASPTTGSDRSSDSSATIPRLITSTTTTTHLSFVSVFPQASSTKTTCAPKSDSLFIYSYFGMGLVTNHGGTYDSGTYGWIYDTSRNCSVAPVTEIRVEDKSGIKSQTTLSFNLNYDQNVSNCWRISRVSKLGQSEWSNQVCYTAPAKKISVPKSNSKSLVPRGVTGAQCLDGYRTNVRSKSACSSHFGRDYWLYKPVSTGYVFTYRPRRSTSNLGFATGRCVGICYGVLSSVNGLPRNTYVSGYFRKDGTRVGPYTRSSP